MTESKTCIYCAKAVKTEDGDVCINCKAKISTFKKTKLKKQFEKFEVEKQDDLKPVIDEENEIFPIPGKGQMIEGLLKTARDMLEGKINHSDASALLQKIEANVLKVFDSLMEDMEKIPIDVENYRELLMEKMEKVEFLFRAGLQEIARFNHDGDPLHIEYGMMLCRIGEERYIQLLKKVSQDATGSPFEGMGNVPEQLASEFKKGKISKKQFDEEIQQLKRTADDYISKAKELMDKGFGLAVNFDGQDDEKMIEALVHFDQAEEMLSKVVINFHSSDEIERTALLFQD